VVVVEPAPRGAGFALIMLAAIGGRRVRVLRRELAALREIAGAAASQKSAPASRRASPRTGAMLSSPQ
jgi:MYXO-CTERM domain-containing protein